MYIICFIHISLRAIMIPNALNNITIQDLNQLIAESRTEDRTIEYKLIVPGNADSEKIPLLLKPVCSFANTDGGDLIFGVRAQDGIPQEIVGVDIASLDQLKLTLEHVLQSGIEPQLRGIGIKEIPLSGNKYVLVVRVPKSWISPHRVKNNARFYARNSAGGYELDVPQIKQSFYLSETLAERIRAFRADRIAVVSSNVSPVPLQEGARLMLHILPLASFASPNMFSVSQYEELWRLMCPCNSGSINYHLNFEGIVVGSGTEENGFRAYSQLFRSGIFEFVRVYEPRDQQKYIPSADYEQALMSGFKNGLLVLQRLGVSQPMWINLTIVGAKGYRLGVGQNTRFNNNEPRYFDRDVLAIPDLEIDTFEVNAASILKPLFDFVWNAAGYRGSLNYDDNGVWQANN